MTTTARPDWETISSYSRAQALDDGVLVDLSAWARETGFRFPVACTREVWADCIEWTEADDDRKGGIGQDQRGRAHDVLWMLLNAIRRSSGGELVRFALLRTPRDGRGRQPRRVDLICRCGPGDDMAPVLTIMQPGQD